MMQSHFPQSLSWFMMWHGLSLYSIMLKEIFICYSKSSVSSVQEDAPFVLCFCNIFAIQPSLSKSKKTIVPIERQLGQPESNHMMCYIFMCANQPNSSLYFVVLQVCLSTHLWHILTETKNLAGLCPQRLGRLAWDMKPTVWNVSVAHQITL